MNARLTESAAKQVETLLASPAGQMLVQEASKAKDAADGESRATALAAGAKAVAEAQAKWEDANQRFEKQLAIYRPLREKERAALALLAEIEVERSNASFAIDRARSRLEHSLRPLGDELLERTAHDVHLSEMEIASTLRWTNVRKPSAVSGRGEVVEVIEQDPDRHAFVRRCKELRVELQALKGTDITPAAIRAKCEDAMRFIRSHGRLLPVGEGGPRAVPTFAYA